MRKYAFIENNIVVDIKELNDEQVQDESMKKLIIDIQDITPQPEINWLLVGNKLVSPSPISQVVPKSVTPRQIRLALVMSGNSQMLSLIENVIDNLPEPDRTVAKITWEYSTEVQRTNPLLCSMAPLLNITEEDLDYFFIFANTL